MKILLVEDNLMVAKGIIYSLEQKNYDVVHKVNSMQTKEFLKDNSVDLAILDVSLPDEDGFELYEKNLKAKNISTIFLTAKDDENDIVKGL